MSSEEVKWYSISMIYSYVAWLLMFLISIPASIICFITNPIVVLFCDDDGELDGFWSYWQTWDDSCNSKDVMHILPKFLLFDFNKHYLCTEGVEAKDKIKGHPLMEKKYNRLMIENRTRRYTICINNNFTVLERLQRYIHRVYWLSRNNCYGFSFWMLGQHTGPNYQFYVNRPGEFIFARAIRNPYDVSFFDAWIYKLETPIVKFGKRALYWNIFLGWKMNVHDPRVSSRAMIANRIAFKIKEIGG